MNTKYFTRKLLCLGYPDVTTFEVSDILQFRFLVSWLENRFIRHYELDQRKYLNNTEDNKWNEHFDKYLADLCIPFNSHDPNAALDWLLGLAVQNYYTDNDQEKKFSQMTSDKFSKSLESQKLVSSLDTIDVNSEEFKIGVYKLATILNVTHHPDHRRVLEACCSIIVEKFSKDNIEIAKNDEGKTKLEYVNIDEIAHGINENSDKELKIITAVLRLLHIHKLRQLQMDINAIIVAVQEIVADPKTNEKLGKVGY